jgi:hypothetical protein
MVRVENRALRAVMLPFVLVWGVRVAAPAAERIEFNRDVRPILSENCFLCHGHDKNRRKARLRFDVREVAVERGAIVPGKPQESKMVQHIFAADPDEVMPPLKTGKKLTAAQKELLKQWIVAGAEYQPHWAYIQPQPPPIPTTRDASWVRNPIDAFILHTLEARNIRPSREADKATLLRRLSLDLVGLPPAPAEIKSFLADQKPSAYEHQVERLLNSPHFGERMAVPWLDVVRFADTVGYHGDQNQNIFPYRDYVIDSFNRNKPFDQFTIEQLAGDLLPNPSLQARVATGFNRLNMVTREGGAQPKEYLAKYAADRVRTVSMAWLGSTMGCAECHDHKYDPFTSKDFYEMEAFFADVKQWGVYTDYDYTPNPDLKGFSNDHPFPPEIELDSPYLQRRIARLKALVTALNGQAAAKLKADGQKRAAFESWRKSSRAFLSQWPTGWATPRPDLIQESKETETAACTNITVNSDGTISFHPQPAENIRIALPLSNMWIAAVRVEVVPQESEEKMSKGKQRRRSPVVLSARFKAAGASKEVKLAFAHAEADHKRERYANGFAIIGVKERWELTSEDERQTAVWLLDQPFPAREGDILTIDIGRPVLVSARLSVSPFAAAEPLEAGVGAPLFEALSEKAAPDRPARDLVDRTYLLSTQCDPQNLAEVRQVQTEIRECRHGRARTLVTETREPLITRVLPRGNWQDESGEIVQPEVPHFLPQIPHPEGRRLTRLDLAQWLISPENPLTARATMNRLWKQFFGTGLSAVVDDLGAQGEWPVHPELLDWLACEFMQPVWPGPSSLSTQLLHPWDFKHMVKLMVMSATYRQDSNQRPDLKEVDPNNRLLACQSPRRLEAEFVRDNALSIAGILNEDMGGPSAHPYQPAGYYIYIQFPDRDYFPDTDERQYRRGVYTHWQRTFLHPMLANFDAPSREECTANRVVSDTPQQALTLLNDPTFMEASRVFASKLLAEPTRSDAQRLGTAFQRALARAPREPEQKSLLQFLAAQREHYQQRCDESQKLMHIGLAPAPPQEDPAELAAWTQVCRVILNLHETITRY